VRERSFRHDCRLWDDPKASILPFLRPTTTTKETDSEDRVMADSSSEVLVVCHRRSLHQARRLYE
jgi:hypothetical protein